MRERDSGTIQVFISYSHKDEELRDVLSKHLRILEREGIISSWHDRQITAGDEWKGVIDKRLNSAQIILLLISADFLASDYCYDIEMRRALERHENGEATVIPVILRDCYWKSAPFGKLQGLPEDFKPVTSWTNPDTAFTNITRGIIEVVEKLTTSRWPRPSRLSQLEGPHLGPLVYRMCDRTAQEDDFYGFFYKQSRFCPGWPQIYFIRGEERECPESLVERLVRTVIQDYAHDKWGEKRGVVTEKMILWPEEGEEVDRQQRLLARIFREFDRDNYDLTASAFTQAFTSVIDSVIVLRHSVRAVRWNQSEKSLLRWYLQFWDDVGKQSPTPHFIIFFNILYPQQEGKNTWRAFFKRSRFDRNHVEAELRELLNNRSQSPACPTLILKELSCIERDHAKDWFDKHNIFDEAIRLRKCDELFKDSACRHLAEIEMMLKQIHQEFINERGY